MQKQRFKKAERTVTWMNIIFPVCIAAIYVLSLNSTFQTINDTSRGKICENKFYWVKVGIYCITLFAFPMYWILFVLFLRKERNHVWRVNKVWFLFLLIGVESSLGIKLVLGATSNIFY